MNEEQFEQFKKAWESYGNGKQKSSHNWFEQFKKTWESYGVKFTNDDGTYKSLYEVLCEMSSVWQKLNEENQK